MPSARAKRGHVRVLESEVMEVEWDALRPHLKRDAVILVGPDVPLVKAAMAVTLDLDDDVAAWMRDGQVAKVSPKEGESFSDDERFRFLIVQPFVLVQRIDTR